MGQGASADGVLAHLARQEQRAAVSSWGKQQLVAIDSIGNCSLNANEWWLVRPSQPGEHTVRPIFTSQVASLAARTAYLKRRENGNLSVTAPQLHVGLPRGWCRHAGAHYDRNRKTIQVCLIN